jgi:tetratricopeptide (TPR) repeat protein
MSMAEAFTYRAFLSYSHADTGMAKRVHARLEGFHIDKELVGRVTATGPIPKTLRPIFRDRNDFDAGSSLGAETGTALDNSAALILLASPHAARSKYANEEVRLFKSRHPDRPLIPLIVDGEPGDVERECFPPALRFAVKPDGTITDTLADVLAADLREKGDGFELALAKVVARLIGLAPDDVYRRAERERRRQNRLRVAVAAVIAVLAIVGGGLFWQSHQQKQTLDEIAALVDKYSVITPAEAAVPGAKRSLTESITAIAQGAATDPRYAQALALIKAGKPAEAEPLLKAVAEEKAKRADKNAKDAAAAYRNLASIAAVSEPGRARNYYAQAARLDPSDIHGMYLNGWFQEKAGQFGAAQEAYARVIAAAMPGADDKDLLWAKSGMGDIDQQRGDLGAALAAYHEAETIAGRLAASDPGNAGAQRDLSVMYNQVGGVQEAQGNLQAALISYQAAFAIQDHLATSDLSTPQWQRDLSRSYQRIGGVQQAQGNLPAALTSYQAGVAILDRLVNFDPVNAEWQRDLSVSYDRLGDVQSAQGNLPAALTSYQACFAILDRLTTSDPGNSNLQRDLSLSYERIGNVQVEQSDLPAALTSYQAEFAIVDRLAKSDPENGGRQRDLSASYVRLGDVLKLQGNLPAALTSYQASVAIRDRLAKSDPENGGKQQDLSISYDRVGDLLKAQDDLPEALKSYQASVAIKDGLAKADPGNAMRQLDLSQSYETVGDAYDDQHNLVEAIKSFQASLPIRNSLAKVNASNADWQRDLLRSYAKLAFVYQEAGQLTEEREILAAGRATAAKLVEQYPDWAEWKASLDWFDQKIVALKN